MYEFFELLRDFYSDIFFILRRETFQFGTVETNLLSILVSFFIISLVVSAFWKGVSR